MISIQNEIPIIQFIVYFIAAAIPIYLLSIKRKYNNGNNRFLNLTIMLAAFIIMQGIYHLVSALGFSLIAKGVLEPLSFGILVLFGVLFLISKTRTKHEEKIKLT